MTQSPLRAFIPVCVFLPILLTPALASQQNTTSPSGWDSTEAPGVSILLGGLPEGRFQFLDGEVNALAAKVTQVDFRVDRNYAFDQPARSWSRVLLLMAPCDLRKHSPTMNSNPAAPPKLVFVSSVSWPAIRNTTVGKPAPFGGSNGEYRFPLIAPFAKAKGQDLLLDFVFSQGVLANSAAWTALDVYPLDGFDESEWARSPSRLLGSMNCREAGQSRPAVCEAGLFTYRKQAATTQRADKIVAWLSTFFAAPSTPVIQAMGTLLGSPMPVGACQYLHIQPQVFVNGSTNTIGTASIYLGAVPYLPALAGVRIPAQAAYNSPTTRRLELTLTTDSPIAAQEGAYSVNRVSYWAPMSNATQGTFADHQSSPLFRYSYK